jgi:branched-chain amino acid transport system ATP-binding protein
MLRAAHLSVAYGAHRALEDVAVHVDRGEICVILGANGAGKTTLLKTIAGLVTPQAGVEITIGETDITHAAPNRIVEAGLALVPEGRGIFGDLTVRENLLLGAYGVQARERSEERLSKVLELFPKLSERAGQVARTMSGGEQQMVAIGRALMSNPTILMLDEPSLGLSPLLCTELFRSLREIGETGVGILLVEQNARLSLAIADRAYLLENGHIVGEGRAATLANDPAVQKAYLGGAASAASRRFGEGDTAMPLAGTDMSITPADLAVRAARIQHAHVESQRNGGHGHLNGHAVHLADNPKAREPIIVSSQADELSRNAADMAHHAADILAAHIARRRAVAVEAHAAAADTGKRGKKSKKDKKAGKKSKKAKR